MNTELKIKLGYRLSELLRQGQDVLDSEDGYGHLDEGKLHRWWVGCRNFLDHLGESAEHWARYFSDETGPNPLGCREALGAMEALQEEMACDLLGKIEGIIAGEALNSLIEQAEELR